MDSTLAPPTSTTPQQTAPLPLRFHVPPGWPQPSAVWLATHQGWPPPPGWTPSTGLPAAPEPWQWWTQDPEGWASASRDVRGEIRRSLTVSSVIFVAGVVLTIAAMPHDTALIALFWGAVVFGPVDIARKIRAHLRRDAYMESRIRDRAAELRAELASDGAPTHWSSDASARGLADRYRFPVPRYSGKHAALTLVLAVAAGFALLLIVQSTLLGGDLGSGA